MPDRGQGRAGAGARAGRGRGRPPDHRGRARRLRRLDGRGGDRQHRPASGRPAGRRPASCRPTCSPARAATPRPATASRSGRAPADLDVEAAAADAARRATRLLGATKPASGRCHRRARPVGHGPVPRRPVAARCRARRCSRAGRCSPNGSGERGGRRPGSRSSTTRPTPGVRGAAGPTARGWPPGATCSSTAACWQGSCTTPTPAGARAPRRPARPCGGSRPRRASAPGRWRSCPAGAPRPSCSPTIGDGVLVQSVKGLHSGVNPVSGDFSTGAEGLAHPRRRAGRAVAGLHHRVDAPAHAARRGRRGGRRRVAADAGRRRQPGRRRRHDQRRLSRLGPRSRRTGVGIRRWLVGPAFDALVIGIRPSTFGFAGQGRAARAARSSRRSSADSTA